MQMAEVGTLRKWHELAYDRFLNATDQMSDTDLRHQISPRELPAAWHLWHIGRFADVVQSGFANRPQVWHSGSLADAWRMRPEQLGLHETGTYMDQDVALAMEWPEGGALKAYVRQAVDAANDATRFVTPENFEERVYRVPDTEGVVLTFGDLLTRSVWHTGRHLGSLDLITASLRETRQERRER